MIVQDMIILPVILGGINIGFQTRFLDGSGKYHATGDISYVLFGEDGPADHYYLAEGAYDCMALQAQSKKAVCPLQGIHLSRHQAARLCRLTSSVTIKYDEDEAGRRGAVRVTAKLRKLGMHVEVE